MNVKYCPKCHGPTKVNREVIFWQLGLLATIIGDVQTREFNDSDFSGLMTILYEIADKIFPEGQHAK